MTYTTYQEGNFARGQAAPDNGVALVTRTTPIEDFASSTRLGRWSDPTWDEAAAAIGDRRR